LSLSSVFFFFASGTEISTNLSVMFWTASISSCRFCRESKLPEPSGNIVLDGALLRLVILNTDMAAAKVSASTTSRKNYAATLLFGTVTTFLLFEVSQLVECTTIHCRANTVQLFPYHLICVCMCCGVLFRVVAKHNHKSHIVKHAKYTYIMLATLELEANFLSN